MVTVSPWLSVMLSEYTDGAGAGLAVGVSFSASTQAAAAREMTAANRNRIACARTRSIELWPLSDSYSSVE